MRRLLLALLIAAAPAAFSQTVPDPIIRSVTPLAGPSSGRTAVTIAGHSLSAPPNFACILPCPTRVTFDGIEGTVTQDSNEALVVRTPPHAPGGARIEIITPDGRKATAPRAFQYVEDIEASFERMLLPLDLAMSHSGNHGSQWQTEFWIRNNGQESVTLAPWPCPPGQACPAVFPLTRSLEPGETLMNLPPIDKGPAGRLLYISRDKGRAVSTMLRLRELSQSDRDAGTEVPVVRESDWFSRTSHFHAVPVDGRSRVLLRIYEFGGEGGEFLVSLYPETTGTGSQPLEQFSLQIAAPPAGAFREQPAYVESAALTNLLNRPAIGPWPVRIDVQPLRENSLYWALISITNNATQRVTLVTPQ